MILYIEVLTSWKNKPTIFAGGRENPSFSFVQLCVIFCLNANWRGCTQAHPRQVRVCHFLSLVTRMNRLNRACPWSKQTLSGVALVWNPGPLSVPPCTEQALVCALPTPRSRPWSYSHNPVWLYPSWKEVHMKAIAATCFWPSSWVFLSHTMSQKGHVLAWISSHSKSVRTGELEEPGKRQGLPPKDLSAQTFLPCLEEWRRLPYIQKISSLHTAHSRPGRLWMEGLPAQLPE